MGAPPRRTILLNSGLSLCGAGRQGDPRSRILFLCPCFLCIPFPQWEVPGEEGHNLSEKDTLSLNARGENAPATEENGGDQAPEMRGEVAWVTQGQSRAETFIRYV